MKIPFLDLKTQYHSIKDEVLISINNVLENTAFALGKSVADFEQEFAAAHSVKHCIAVSSGTDGNHMVLWALGIGQGDEVIIPANTFVATAWGATLCGATPVFVDCHTDSYNINPSKIVEAITPKTKAIVLVHLYGQPADVDAVSNELKAKNYELKKKGVYVHKTSGQIIYLVEDCAQSHISEYNGKKVGGLEIASSFSFYPGKNLGAYGEGGAVCTDDDELAVKFRMIRDHGAKQKYVHEIYGHNYRMEGLQGAVLGVKLKYLKSWTDARRKVATKYNELLKDVKEIKLPVEMPYSKHVYHLFVIQLLDTKTHSRDEFAKYLNDNGISTGFHYPIPLHLQPCFKHLGYKKGDFPETEKLASNGISLPMYPELNDEQMEYISDKIKRFFL
jgi:dTDP-4-amino-4,6-dideoxygalactose transaminase